MGIYFQGLEDILGILWDPKKVSLSGFNGNHRFISAKFGVIGFLVTGILSNVHGPHIT